MISLTNLMESIEQLQNRSQSLDADAGARLLQVDSIQDGLIQQLEELDLRVQQCIAALTAERSQTDLSLPAKEQSTLTRAA